MPGPWSVAVAFIRSAITSANASSSSSVAFPSTSNTPQSVAFDPSRTYPHSQRNVGWKAIRSTFALLLLQQGGRGASNRWH